MWKKDPSPDGYVCRMKILQRIVCTFISTKYTIVGHVGYVFQQMHVLTSDSLLSTRKQLRNDYCPDPAVVQSADDNDGYLNVECAHSLVTAEGNCWFGTVILS
jgi:hypothetical protein